MRIERIAAGAVLVTFIGCSISPDELAPGELAIRSASTTQGIQGGTLDTTHNAVVAIMIRTPAGIAICSGSLIGPNLVLSAHHCVADPSSTACGSAFSANYAVGSFAITTSPTAASTYFSTGRFPTVDNSTWFGVSAVSTPTPNDICGGDMSLLELSAPITGVCPLVPAVDAPSTTNEPYTAVGYGITSPLSQSAGTRYQVSGLTVLCVGSACGTGVSATKEWIGGTSAAKGTCEGDSGGPSLDSLGRIMGTVSRGPQGACNQTVYEATSGNAAWIKAQAITAATHGGYAPAAWTGGAATSNPSNGYCGGGTGGGAGGGTGGGTGGGSTGGGAGGGSTGGGSGGSGGTCANPALVCSDVTGRGNWECVDPTTATTIPVGATRCSSTNPCAATSYSCWYTSATATRGYCLQDCPPSAAGGGTGGSTGGSAGGGTGGTGGSAGGGTGGTGGSAGGGTGGTGGSTGGSAGGGTGGTGGSTGGSAGGGTGGSTGGSAGGGTGGGSGGNITSTPSCGCQGIPAGFSTGWMALLGLGLVARRRRAR